MERGVTAADSTGEAAVTEAASAARFRLALPWRTHKYEA
jgi:hypothetical protein